MSGSGKSRLRLVIAGMLWLSAPTLAAPAPASRAGNPCRAALAPILAQANEIRRAYEPAERGDNRAEACRLARNYIDNLDRLIASWRRLPAGCAPADAATQQQLASRERIAWMGKAHRQCGPGSPASGGHQHRILKVP